MIVMSNCKYIIGIKYQTATPVTVGGPCIRKAVWRTSSAFGAQNTSTHFVGICSYGCVKDNVLTYNSCWHILLPGSTTIIIVYGQCAHGIWLFAIVYNGDTLSSQKPFFRCKFQCRVTFIYYLIQIPKMYVGVKMTVFWDVAQCRLVEFYWRIRDACCLHHQGRL
jgi:hypothetical protein